MQVEEVRFNHDTSAATNDALTIASDGSSGAIAAPEWQRFPTRRLPCAYALGAISGAVTIKVRFSGGPPNATRRIRAVDANPVPPQQPGCLGSIIHAFQQWLHALFGTVGEVLERNVSFDAAGNSALETFTLNASYLGANGVVTKRNTVWKWQLKSGKTWVDFDNTDHTMYITADLPTAPWVQSGTPSQLPWATALERACMWAIGSKTKDEVAAAITREVNRVANVSYTPATMFGFNNYQLTSYLTHLTGGAFVMNCTDAADAVTTLSNLLGCNLAEGRFFNMQTRQFLTLSGDPNVAADWVSWNWGYHEICWQNDFSSNTVWDGCLQLDMSNTPGVHVAQLPVKMLFSVPAPNDYKTRLIATGTGNLEGFVRHRAVV
ncbi:MAG TPA: hypothetical protein VNI54_10355 [Thermoanaerobaculia bacterium]|nr:hypothetical protein [Thermoanaerobaculia bacterium]